MDGVQPALRLVPLRGGSLLFTTKFPDISSRLFYDFVKMTILQNLAVFTIFNCPLFTFSKNETLES